MNCNLKRKLSSDTYKLAYDFSAECKHLNSIVARREPIQVDHEYEISQLIVGLHEAYEKKFIELFQMRFAPKDSLNRFLYEQLSLKNCPGSLIKAPENILQMNTIDKEIRTSFPITSNFKDDSPKWKLINNLKDCIHISDKFSLGKECINRYDNEPLKKLLNNEIIYSEFKSVRNDLFHLLETDIEEKINQIKSFLFEELKSILVKIETILATIPFNNIEFKVKIVVNRGDDFVFVHYREQKLKLLRFHYEKLKTLFNLNKKKFKNSVNFEERVYCLLSRYQTFFKYNEVINEGYGMQASLPSKVFVELNRTFKVKQEMFASPFNCYFKQYCSAFPDTDVFFGSQGSFFDFDPNENSSFQCNPPFTEEVIERLADRIEYLLENSKYALSYLVFIPEWIEPPTPGLVKMEKSKFNRMHFNVDNGAHHYVSGSQHVSNEDPQLYTAMHNTRVFVLQNEAGYSLFTPTKEKIEKLKEAMTFF